MADYELVLVSVISGLFGILGLYIIQHNYIAKWKLNFELEKYKARNKRKNIPPPQNPSPKSGLDGVKNILSLVQNLDSDTLQNLSSLLGKGEMAEDEGRPQGISDMILDFAKDNPELVQSFLQGVKDKTTSGGEESQHFV